MASMRKETDSLGIVEVAADKLWGAQTQRSLEHFSIGTDLIPREMITAYATLKKGAAIANHASKRLDDEQYKLIVQTCDEILRGQHHDMFPLHVWMTGSGTQFNMNVNEVISNRCCQLAGTPLGSHAPVHPNDHVNMAQSSNDSFPSAMYIAAAVNVKERLVPAISALRDAIAAKSKSWSDIVKIGRTHMQDATPLTLGQEWSGRFPAVGMAIFATQAKRVTDEMFIEAGQAVADQVPPALLNQGLLYPLQANILETEIQTAARVAKLVFDSGLARVERPADMVSFIRRHVYKPEYSVVATAATKAA